MSLNRSPRDPDVNHQAASASGCMFLASVKINFLPGGSDHEARSTIPSPPKKGGMPFLI